MTGTPHTETRLDRVGRRLGWMAVGAGLLAVVIWIFPPAGLLSDYEDRGVVEIPEMPPAHQHPSTILSSGIMEYDSNGCYIVQPGDNLIDIGRRSGIPWRDIAAVNGLEDPYPIYVGQRLAIP